MFYFFEKEGDFVRFEMRPTRGDACDIVITESSGHERVEHYPSCDAVQTRWDELKRRFHADGWLGPFGRE